VKGKVGRINRVSCADTGSGLCGELDSDSVGLLRDKIADSFKLSLLAAENRRVDFPMTYNAMRHGKMRRSVQDASVYLFPISVTVHRAVGERTSVRHDSTSSHTQTCQFRRQTNQIPSADPLDLLFPAIVTQILINSHPKVPNSRFSCPFISF
jgi:hypothetical protein